MIMSTQHPLIERLAALVDEEPTLFEREHLAHCPACREELESFRRLAGLSRDERRRIAPPLTAWESLAPALADAGLLDTGARKARSSSLTWMQRAAAAILLLGSGAVAGRMTASPDEGLPVANGLESEARMLPVSRGRGFSSTEDALEQIGEAQRLYAEAANWLAVHDTSSAGTSSDQYRTRLAALDLASETFEQALTDAPEDPVLNQYLMATMNAREVTIRRLGATLPASVRVGRF
jgi:hypothetical protein